MLSRVIAVDRLRAAFACVLAALLFAVPAGAKAQSPGEPWLGPYVPLSLIGPSTLRGGIALRPTGTGEYLLWAHVRADNEPAGRTFAAALVHGACAEWMDFPPVGTGAAVPAAALLGLWEQLPRVSTTERRLDATALADPLMYLIAEGNGAGPLRACADLPVARVRALEPAPGTPPATASFQPAPGWRIRGQLKAWPTASGDVLIQVAAGGLSSVQTPGSGQVNLRWTLARGRGQVCPAWQESSVRRTNPADLEVLYMFTAPIDAHGALSFSLMVRAAAGQSIVLAAFADGSLTTCAELPFTAASAQTRLPTAPARPPALPGTGARPPIGRRASWATLLVLGIIVAGSPLVGHTSRRRAHAKRMLRDDP